MEWKKKDYKMYIGGEWVDATDGKRFDSLNPATLEVIGTVPSGSREDAGKAIGAAAKAFESYRFTSVWERSAILRRISELVEKNKDELAYLLSLEQGKPLHTEAYGEVGAVAVSFQDASEQIKWLEGEVIPAEDKNKRVMTFYQPRGVYAVITPWNYPLNIPSEYIVAALATGNTVVWSPASTTPLCAVRLTEIFEEAGVPAGVINMVTGKGSVVGDEFVVSSGTVGVGFTGSTEVGDTIASRGAGKPMLLELGGNDACIIMDDADLDLAIPRIAAGAFSNAGQVCAATERVLVCESLVEEVAERLTLEAKKLKLGSQLDKGTNMGPMNNDEVFSKVIEQAEDAKRRGAKFLTGGEPIKSMGEGYFYSPTVVTDVPLDSLYNTEETFGPVAPIISFKTKEEALEIANMSKWGLSMSVFTNDIKTAFFFGERLASGIVNINDNNSYWEMHMPFGGAGGKKSGIGRLGGTHTMKAMSDIKTITFDLSEH